MKYRKKPVVIEAFQFTSGSVIPKWFEEAVIWGRAMMGFNNDGWFADINTLEGVMHVSDGDYIIRGVRGELYPCKPDIFKNTYEPVEENNDQATL